MLRPADGSEPSSLPQAELNPLSNPVLAQNMGRWAEVYFTTPPEKREEAVLELIRELESQQAAGGTIASGPGPTLAHQALLDPTRTDSIPLDSNHTDSIRADRLAEDSSRDFSHEPAHDISRDTIFASKAREATPTILACPSCHSANAVDQRFCGMCGQPLRTAENYNANGSNHSGAEQHDADFFPPDLPPPDFRRIDFKPSADAPEESRLLEREISAPHLREEHSATEYAEPDAAYQAASHPTGTYSSSYSPGAYSPEQTYSSEQTGRILIPLDMPSNVTVGVRDSDAEDALHDSPTGGHGDHHNGPGYADGGNYDRELNSLRQSLAGGEDFDESGSFFDHHRYRIYAGVVLTMLVGTLIYMAWRGTEAFTTQGLPAVPTAAPQTTSASNTAGATPATPDAGNGAASTAPTPAAASNSAASEAPAANAAGKNLSNTNSTAASSRDSASPAQETDSDQEPDTRETAANAAHTPVQPASRAERISDPGSSASTRGNGSEELAVAEGFLGNKPGQSKDTTEAAKWLWKSVSKQNATAAMLLSDLYAHGDGVPRSCDQARLLLDAAARKSAAGATERLRNLQTEGCR